MSQKPRCTVIACDRTRHHQSGISAAVCTPHYYAIKRGIDYAESRFSIDDLEPLEYEGLRA